MRPALTCFLAVLSLAGLPACGVGEVSGGSELEQSTGALSGFEHPGRVSPDADLTAPPEAGGVNLWIMGDQWRTDVWPPLFQGAEATLSVSADRINACGPDATATAFLASPDGKVLTVPLGTAGAPGGKFQVPGSVRSLSLWVKVEGADGCVAYDSNYGRNYSLPVHRWAPVRVRFDASGAPVADGPLVQGGVVAVDYAQERLPNCRIVYRGFPGWDIIAHASFDGVEVPGASVLLRGWGGGNGDGTFPKALAYFPIPWDASEAQLWFENNEYPPLCHEWDSNGGANYRFPLSAPGSTPPTSRLVFGPDWSEHATAPLYGGAALTVEVASGRFPTCGIGGEVTAALRTGSGEIVTARLDGWPQSGARQGSLTLPAGTGHVELWLHATRADGCDEYDSDYGANYGFDLQAW